MPRTGRPRLRDDARISVVSIPFPDPFRLRVPLIRGESLVGFARRLVQRNQLTIGNGVRRLLGGNLIPTMLAGQRLETLSMVSCRTPEDIADAIGSSCSDFGKATNQGWWRPATSAPVCPDCLTDSPHHRQAWMHRMIVLCPIHECELLEACPDPACGAPLDALRPSLDKCPAGHPLISRRSEPGEAPLVSMTCHLYRRLGESAAAPSGMLNETIASMSDADLQLFIAKLAVLADKVDANGTALVADRSATAVRRAMSVAAQWPVGLRDLLSPVVAQATPCFVNKTFRIWLLNTFLKILEKQSSVVYETLLGALSDMAADLGDEVTFLHRNGAGDLLPIDLAAKMLGKRWQSTMALASHEGWTIISYGDGGKVKRYLRKSEIEAFLEREQDDCLAISEVAAQLNILPRYIRELAARGLLGDAARDTVTAGEDLRGIRRSAVKAFHERFTSERANAEVDDKFEKAEYFGRRQLHTRYRLADLLEAAANGKIRCLRATEEVKSWRFHRGDVDGLKLVRPNASTAEDLTVYEAVSISGFKYMTLKKAGDVGMLRMARGRDGRLRIRQSELLAFMEEWANINHIQNEARLTARQVHRLLDSLNIPRTEIDDAVLVRRGDLGKSGILA